MPWRNVVVLLRKRRRLRNARVVIWYVHVYYAELVGSLLCAFHIFTHMSFFFVPTTTGLHPGSLGHGQDIFGPSSLAIAGRAQRSLFYYRKIRCLGSRGASGGFAARHGVAVPTNCRLGHGEWW